MSSKDGRYSFFRHGGFDVPRLDSLQSVLCFNTLCLVNLFLVTKCKQSILIHVYMKVPKSKVNRAFVGVQVFRKQSLKFSHQEKQKAFCCHLFSLRS